jgi:hypothetical protein
MPIRRDKLDQGSTSYATLDMFKGPMSHTDTVRVDVSALTSDEVDDDGYLKPGVPFDKDGDLVAGDGNGNVAPVHGVTVEPTRVGDGSGSPTGNYDVAVATIGQLIQPVAEENLGRDYTADELTGFEGGSGTNAGSPSQIVLV